MDISQMIIIIALVVGILWIFSWSFKRTVRRWNRRVEELFETAPFKITAIIVWLFTYVFGLESTEKTIMLTIISTAFAMKVIMDLGNWINSEMQKNDAIALQKQKDEEKELYKKEMLNFFSGKNVEIDDIRGY